MPQSVEQIDHWKICVSARRKRGHLTIHPTLGIKLVIKLREKFNIIVELVSFAINPLLEVYIPRIAIYRSLTVNCRLVELKYILRPVNTGTSLNNGKRMQARYVSQRQTGRW